MVMTGENRVAQTEAASRFDLASYLKSKKQLVEAALDASLPITRPEKIYEAMRYSLLAGGKRLRPILCLTTCELMGGTTEMALPTACALEMIHTMSLIHDDLPSMDDDDYRRGKLTNHKVYGEDIAILAGDALLSYEGKSDVTVETLKFIHIHKTGALLETSVVSGAILAGAAREDVQRLSKYAQNIGLAFQIIDDILDVTSTQEELGKTAGKDERDRKATYPSLWGIEESQKQAQTLIDEAIAQLIPYGDAAVPLEAIARFIITRKN